MEHEFWHQRWQSNQIGFHEAEPNPLLTSFFSHLNLPTGSTVLVPLCGKSHDLAWLAQHGYRVWGIELSELAVETFFKEQSITAQRMDRGELTAYRSENIEILVGDFFNVTAEHLPKVDAVYDRAAIVALPEPKRHRYTSHLVQLSVRAQQLIVTYEYDQSTMPGPPFSVDEQELRSHYQQDYSITLLHEQTVPGKLKGSQAIEKVWLCIPKPGCA